MFIRLILFSLTLTVDHSKNFHCNLRYDNLFFEDICCNESKEQLFNTSGQTPTDNVLRHIVSQRNSNIFAPDDDLESRPRVITISNDTNDNDMNHFEASNTISEIRIKNLNNIIIGHLNVNSLPNRIDSLTSIIKNYIDIIVFIIIIIIIRLTCQFHLKWVARLLCLS